MKLKHWKRAAKLFSHRKSHPKGDLLRSCRIGKKKKNTLTKTIPEAASLHMLSAQSKQLAAVHLVFILGWGLLPIAIADAPLKTAPGTRHSALDTRQPNTPVTRLQSAAFTGLQLPGCFCRCWCFCLIWPGEGCKLCEHSQAR